jgi:hypothetical protein
MTWRVLKESHTQLNRKRYGSAQNDLIGDSRAFLVDGVGWVLRLLFDATEGLEALRLMPCLLWLPRPGVVTDNE